MITKSFTIENDIGILKNNQVLFQNYANTIWTSSKEGLNQLDFQKDILD